MYRAVVKLVGQSTWSRRWEGLALIIPEGPLVCDDALGAPPTSPFELCKPRETWGQTERFPVSRGGCKPGIEARDTNPGTDGTFSGFARSPHRQEARRLFPRHLLLLRPAPCCPTNSPPACARWFR